MLLEMPLQYTLHINKVTAGNITSKQVQTATAAVLAAVIVGVVVVSFGLYKSLTES